MCDLVHTSRLPPRSTTTPPTGGGGYGGRRGPRAGGQGGPRTALHAPLGLQRARRRSGSPLPPLAPHPPPPRPTPGACGGSPGAGGASCEMVTPLPRPPPASPRSRGRREAPEREGRPRREAPLAARRTWLSAAGMPDSSSHSARKLCSSKSASTWREKVTSERSLRTQYTVSSMAPAWSGSLRRGPGSARGCGRRQGLAGAAGRRRGLRAPSLSHSHSHTHARRLPPSGPDERAPPPPATPSAARRPAFHRGRQARQPPAPRPAATRLP